MKARSGMPSSAWQSADENNDCRDPKFLAHLSLDFVYRMCVDLGEGEQQSQDVQEECLAFGRVSLPT